MFAKGSAATHRGRSRGGGRVPLLVRQRGVNLLLNVLPDKDGLIPDAYTATLMCLRQAAGLCSVSFTSPKREQGFLPARSSLPAWAGEQGMRAGNALH